MITFQIVGDTARRELLELLAYETSRELPLWINMDDSGQKGGGLSNSGCVECLFTLENCCYAAALAIVTDS